MSQPSDQYCIDAVINGDVQTFSVLVDRYKHMVFSLAMKMLKNREEAEEVAQDVFLKVYQALTTFKGESKFSTWLYKIAYHRCLDSIKKNGRAIQTTSIDEFAIHHIPAMDSTLDGLEAKDRKAIIKAAIAELSAEDGVVITLHYFEALSLKEISKVMGLSVDTVKVRLFRSRKRLANLLANRLQPETLKTYGKG
tara:strand:- start:275 stop:859 length:585 start_codon:yes stop_codon:yes gene_type:complete